LKKSVGRAGVTALQSADERDVPVGNGEVAYDGRLARDRFVGFGDGFHGFA
jgi:hypothetical protein